MVLILSQHILFFNIFYFFTLLLYTHTHTRIVPYSAALRMTHTYTIIRDINKTPCHASGRKPHRRHTLIISSRKFWIRTQTYTPIYVHIMLRLLFVSRFFTTRKFSTQRVAYMRYSCAIIHTLRLDAYTRHIIIYISVRTCFVARSVFVRIQLYKSDEICPTKDEM